MKPVLDVPNEERVAVIRRLCLHDLSFQRTVAEWSMRWAVRAADAFSEAERFQRKMSRMDRAIFRLLGFGWFGCGFIVGHTQAFGWPHAVLALTVVAGAGVTGLLLHRNRVQAQNLEDMIRQRGIDCQAIAAAYRRASAGDDHIN